MLGGNSGTKSFFHRLCQATNGCSVTGVCVGDVCLIRYKNDTRATYRLGRVTEAKKGSDGLVRKVSLDYKLPNEKNFRSVERPIHGIAVIVPIEEQDKPLLNPTASDFVPNSK